MIEVKLIGKPLVVGVSDEHEEEVTRLKFDHIMNLINAEEYNREILKLGNF